jgi:hypothetical protein
LTYQAGLSYPFSTKKKYFIRRYPLGPGAGLYPGRVLRYDDLMRFGSEKVLREKGHMRPEGKIYIVRDGDILNIRFGV